MTNDGTIRGYRVLGERKPERTLSTEYLKLSRAASHALQDLWREAAIKGSNCIDREDEFTNDKLPTNRQAQMMCAGCPVFEKCDTFTKTQHPAYGVWAGRVWGRKLEEALTEGENA